ncbi:hypothetical protein EYF80_050473 [Liparis tanakae]|uniref:Uncharacterized protein n=1 Tax=Liparis tanakae TaxID=230148 RepID=A0A4Z2FDS9_9TELE|nr:hypothetical protein EYF80_050473 [Liparis tanakae]
MATARPSREARQQARGRGRHVTAASLLRQQTGRVETAELHQRGPESSQGHLDQLEDSLDQARSHWAQVGQENSRSRLDLHLLGRAVPQLPLLPLAVLPVVLPGSLPPGVPELLLQGGDRVAVTGLLRLVVGKGMFARSWIRASFSCKTVARAQSLCFHTSLSFSTSFSSRSLSSRASHNHTVFEGSRDAAETSRSPLMEGAGSRSSEGFGPRVYRVRTWRTSWLHCSTALSVSRSPSRSLPAFLRASTSSSMLFSFSVTSDLSVCRAACGRHNTSSRHTTNQDSNETPMELKPSVWRTERHIWCW